MSLKKRQARVAARVKEQDERVDTFIANFSLWFESSIEDILDEVSLGNSKPAAAVGGLITGMYERGLVDELNKMGEVYGRELASIRREFEADNLEFQLVDSETVRALIEYRVEDIENKAVNVIGSLRPLILENIITGDRPDFKSLEETVNSQLINYAKTEFNTAIANFDRTVTYVQAKKIGIKKFLYIGPNDKITRPFCRAILTQKSPPIYTEEEIKGLDNGQGLNVQQSAGGYNCRHEWSPVSDQLEAELNGE